MHERILRKRLKACRFCEGLCGLLILPILRCVKVNIIRMLNLRLHIPHTLFRLFVECSPALRLENKRHKIGKCAGAEEGNEAPKRCRSKPGIIEKPGKEYDNRRNNGEYERHSQFKQNRHLP